MALKDAAGNPAETARVIADTPDDFEVYSGDDSMTLPLLSVGAVGVVGVARTGAPARWPSWSPHSARATSNGPAS